MKDRTAKRIVVLGVGGWALLWVVAIVLAASGHNQLLLSLLGISLVSGLVLLGLMYSERNLP